MDALGARLKYEEDAKQKKCGCTGCSNRATHTWGGHPTCDDCATPHRKENILPSLHVRTVGEYDLWMKPCEKCGFDSAKISEKSSRRCWKCGSQLSRDFSDRALKVNSRESIS